VPILLHINLLREDVTTELTAFFHKTMDTIKYGRTSSRKVANQGCNSGSHTLKRSDARISLHYIKVSTQPLMIKLMIWFSIYLIPIEISAYNRKQAAPLMILFHPDQNPSLRT
jgi:hypothetical protein